MAIATAAVMNEAEEQDFEGVADAEEEPNLDEKDKNF